MNDESPEPDSDEGFPAEAGWDRTGAVAAGLGLLGAAIVLVIFSVIGSGGVTDDDVLFDDAKWPANLAVLIGSCLTLAFAAAAMALPQRRGLGWRAAAVLTATGTVLVVLGMQGAFGLFSTLSENGDDLGSGLPRAKTACWLAVAGGVLIVMAFRGAAPVRRMVVAVVAAATVVVTVVSVALLSPWEPDPSGALSISGGAKPTAGDLPTAIDLASASPLTGDLAKALADVDDESKSVGNTPFATDDGVLLSQPDRDKVSMYNGDGSRRWTAHNPGYGIRVLDDAGLVVLSDDDHSYGVDARTGALKWTATPAIWAGEEPTGKNFRPVHQLTSIGDHGRTLLVLDPVTGDVAQRFSVPDECAIGEVVDLPASVIAEVACGGGRAYYQRSELPSGTAAEVAPIDGEDRPSGADLSVRFSRLHPELADRYEVELAPDGTVVGIIDRKTGTSVADLHHRTLFSCSPDGDCLIVGDRNEVPRELTIVSLNGAHPDLPLTSAIDDIWPGSTDAVWLRDQVLWLDDDGRIQVADRRTGAVRMADVFRSTDSEGEPTQLTSVPGAVLAVGHDQIVRLGGVRR